MSEDFDSLVRHIQNTSDVLQQDARLVINRNVTTRAWLTGFYIVEYEQHGKESGIHHSLNGKSEDEGKRQIVPERSAICVPSQVSRDGFAVQLASGEVMPVPELGSGFGVRQLEYCRQFYRIYPIANTVRSQLNRSQYRLLIQIPDPDKRAYYELESVNNSWTARETKPSINCICPQKPSLSRRLTR